MSTLTLQPPSSTHHLSPEAEAAISAVIGNRLQISYRELDECFRIARGVGVGRHKIREWEDQGMPHHHHPEDRFYYYVWRDVWAWYCQRGQTRTPRPKSSTITAQTWIRSEA